MSGLVDERVGKWRGLAWGYWLAFGIVPICAGFMIAMSMSPGSETVVDILFGLSTAVAVLLAILAVPGKRPWVWGAVAFVWFLGMMFWHHMLVDLYFRIDFARMSSKYGTPLNVVQARSGIHNYWSALTTMTVSAGLMFGVTRSWRSFAMVAAPVVLLLLSRWVSHFIEAAIILWHPLFAGALVLWAFPQRMRALPDYLCYRCRYDLRGLGEGAKCPECGG